MATIQPAAADSHKDKLDRALTEAADRDGRVRVIVQVDPGSRGAVKRALTAQGYVVANEHAVISALSLEVPTKALDGIAHMPGVPSISFDAPMQPTQVVVPTTNGDMLRQDLGIASSGYEGSGVGVAVIDSGSRRSVRSARASARSTTSRWGAWPPRRMTSTVTAHTSPPPSLATAHRTARRIQAWRPSASLVGLKVLDANGQGFTSNVISAIEFAITNRGAASSRRD